MGLVQLMLRGLVAIADVLVPRFVTEYVPVTRKADGTYITGDVELSLVEEHEHYDGYVQITSFNILGCGFFGRVVGDVRPWGTRHEVMKK